MGRLVFGKNRCAMLTNGSSYPKTSSWAVTGTNDFMCIPLRNIDNPKVINRGRLLLCVDSVWKECKKCSPLQISTQISTQSTIFFVNLTVENIFGKYLPIKECLVLLLWDLYPLTSLVQSLIFSCVDNLRYHCYGKRYSLFPYPLCYTC